MFTCAKIRNGSTYLSNHLSANDYYAEGEHVVGVWVGKAAERLGLEGKSIGHDDPAFEALRLNQAPNGTGKLTPRSVENAIRFFDFQCSAQKSVSIMAITMGDHRLVQAHDLAARRALAELEKLAAVQLSLGKRKHRETTGNLCAAAFRHDASRELDPQLHTHFVVANASYDVKSRRWLALETYDMFKAIRYAGKCYQNELAAQCRCLGYEIEPIRGKKGLIEGFEIKGVPEELRQRFSKRRAEVEAAIVRFLDERGREPNAPEIAALTRETRSFKLKEITTPEVLVRQREQLSTTELRSLEGIHNAALARPYSEPAMHSTEKFLTAARQHLFERRSVLAAHEILAEGLNQGLGKLDREKLKTALETHKGGMIPLGERTRESLSQAYGTPEGLALERWAVEFVNRTKGIDRPFGRSEGVAFQFQSEEQHRVVRQILGSRDRACTLRGMAGTGKTTALKEISRGLEACGANLYYLAPTASAAKVLRGDGFGSATTLADFLTNRLKAEAQQLRNAVLIVDEAGLQSNKLGAAVLKVAERYGSRVLFVGDTRQHVSVEAGDFLRILESHSKMEVAELRDIRRQTVQEYNRAVREMACGKPAAGMERLQRLGWVEEARNGYLEAAADAYLKETDSGKQLDRVIAVSPTWAENHRFTEAIRTRLKTAGCISDGCDIQVHESLNWTRQQLGIAGNYKPGMVVTFNLGTAAVPAGTSLSVERVEGSQVYLKGYEKPFTARRLADKVAVSEQRTIELSVGDRILIRRNFRPAGVVNGDVLTVARINPDLTIHTKEKTILPPNFRDFCHGHVVTSHKAQGRTHDSVILAAAEVDSKTAYVACSRGRQRCSVFTPDLDHFMKGLPRSGDRTAALDITPPQLQQSQPPRTSDFRNWWDSIKDQGIHFLHRLQDSLTPSLMHQTPAEQVLTRRQLALDKALGP